MVRLLLMVTGLLSLFLVATSVPGQIVKDTKQALADFKDAHLPTLHVVKAIEYIKANAKDRLYLRFLSDYNGESEEDINNLNWTINQLHLEADVSYLKEIFPKLYVIDLREFGWNAGAFSAVARRETYFREPFIDFNNAAELRELTGTEQDQETLHLEAIVRADWFFRDAIESDRSPTYYDLLFARYRFIPIDYNSNEPEYVTQEEVQDWQGGVDKDGKYYPPGKYKVEKKVKNPKYNANSKVGKFKFVKFPKNEADFEKAFGVDKVFAFIKESGINTQRGAVVEGGEKGVSAVARQNRLVAFTNGPIGIYSKTFDVKATTGKRDFAETLQKDFEFDAGEILATTPCGGLAALLVNDKGDIVETADNRFATDKSDITYDARVRTPGSCFICHEKSWIMPQNLIKEMVEKGVDIKFKNKKDQIDARAFFLNWEKRFISWQTPMTELTERTFKGDPAKRAAAFKKYRDKYDASVNLEKAIKEIGIPKEKFLLAAGKSTKARINNLAVGIDMPRKTWEVDGFFEMVKQLNSKEYHEEIKKRGW